MNPNYNPDINLGHPVEGDDGRSQEVITDFVIPGTNGLLEFSRTYSSGPISGLNDPWSSPDQPANVPVPFGQTPWPVGSISWWHNFFAYVVHDGAGGWTMVRLPGGEYFRYYACGLTGPAVWCTPDPLNAATRAQLYWDGSKYYVLLDTGEAVVYGATFTQWVSGYNTPRYFITGLLDQHGATLATVNYATSAPLTGCTLSDAGASPAGTPYIDTITTGDGTRLKFVYESLTGSVSFSPCVISNINLVLSDGGQQPLVQYTYQGNEPGLLASAAWPAASNNIVDQYTYGTSYPQRPTEFDGTSDAGWLWVRHVYDPNQNDGITGYVTDVYYSAGSTGAQAHDTYTYGTSPLTCPNGVFTPTTCCSATYATTWTEGATQAGNGSGTAVPVAREYDFTPTEAAYGLHEQRIAREVNTCSSSTASCANNAALIPDWTCGAAGSLPFVSFPNASQDKNGYWSVFTIVDAGSRGHAGVPLALTEETQILYGATTESGSGALESASFQYMYDAGSWTNLPWAGSNVQLMTQQSIPSPLGGTATTTYTYDANHRLTAELLTGTTSVFNGSTWSNVPQTRGIFYSATPACAGGTQPDTFLQRTLEVRGPCFDAGTDCPSGVQMPVTEYVYYETNARVTACTTFTPPANQHRLCQVIQYPANTGPGSCSPSGANALRTQFLQYDERGNLLQMQDPNGVTTSFTYDSYSDRVASKVVNQGGPTGTTYTTTYTYDNGELYLVELPAAYLDGGAGLTEVTCHRLGTSPGNCDMTRAWSPQVQWTAKATNPSGTQWTEAMQFTYWTDGTRQSTAYLRNGGSGPVLRTMVNENADGERRPTWTGFGDGGGSFAATLGFDNNDNLTGIGLPYVNPPSWCVTGSGHGLCALLTYNRTNRAGVIDEYPDGGASDITTCVDHDGAGHTSKVSPGCSGGASACAGLDGGTSSCGDDTGGAALTYLWDDFGNVIQSTLPWTYSTYGPTGIGTTHFQYDAMGNVIVKQTPKMTNTGDTIQFKYDALGRLTEADDVGTSGATLYRLSYDGANSTSGQLGCPTQYNTIGRLTTVQDNFGYTWFSYDLEGRVVGEFRKRAVADQCGGNPEDSPHTAYGYNPDGVLTTITMPYYTGFDVGNLGTSKRQVTYALDQTDRVSAIWVQLYTDAGAVDAGIISNVAWEPYGALRGYQVNTLDGGSAAVEYMLGDDAANSPGWTAPGHPPTACTPTAFPVASSSSSDYAGRVRTLAVSSGNFTPGSGTPAADIYKVGYTWQADQLVEMDTCILDGGLPRTETFTYDGMIRLTSASNPTQSDAGGAFSSRSYSYTPRSNLSSVAVDGCNRAMSYYPYSFVDLLSGDNACAGGTLGYTYLYGRDGRATIKTWPNDSTGTAAWQLTIYDGETPGSPSDTVYHAVAVGNTSPLTYNYYTDAFGRRNTKVYPTAGVTDEFLYTRASNLLTDRGVNSTTAPTLYPEDDYVWLDGRPVAMIRGQFDTSWNRQSDFTASCSRNGDTSACGLYFSVTDPVGKPVLMLDGARRVADEADYDPLGFPNRVTLDAENTKSGTPPTYATNINQIVLDAGQPVASPALSLNMRAQFATVDTAAKHCVGNLCCTPGDGTWLIDGNTGTPIGSKYQGGHMGQVWTPWVGPMTISGGKADLQVELYGDNCQVALLGNQCGSCSHKTGTGVIVAAYEYQRYQTGATPFWTPLRFPGQYYDQETDLVENWNRYYDPHVGRYLQPEPLMSLVPGYYADTAVAFGGGASPYAYALDNPISYRDPTGFDIGDRFNTPDEAALDAFRTYGWSATEYGGVIYRRGDGSYSAGERGTQNSETGVEIFVPPPSVLNVVGTYHNHPISANPSLDRDWPNLISKFPLMTHYIWGQRTHELNAFKANPVDLNPFHLIEALRHWNKRRVGDCP